MSDGPLYSVSLYRRELVGAQELLDAGLSGDGEFYRYIPVPTGPAKLLVRQAPAIGDIVDPMGAAASYRVIDLAWRYPAYGSAHWPSWTREPLQIVLILVVEECIGIFLNEAPAILYPDMED